MGKIKYPLQIIALFFFVGGKESGGREDGESQGDESVCKGIFG